MVAGGGDIAQRSMESDDLQQANLESQAWIHGEYARSLESIVPHVQAQSFPRLISYDAKFIRANEAKVQLKVAMRSHGSKSNAKIEDFEVANLVSRQRSRAMLRNVYKQ